MKQSVFTEACSVLAETTQTLEALRLEYYGKRLTAEQRARAKSLLGALARELVTTASVLDGERG